MNAKLIRKQCINHIEIKLEKDNTVDLWEGIMEHCAQDLSTNELKTAYAQVCKQISEMNPDDVPLIFKKMISELQAVIINRKAY